MEPESSPQVLLKVCTPHLLEADLATKLMTRVEDLPVSVRVYNVYGRLRIGEVVQKSPEELLKSKNFGKKSLQEVIGLLGALGLSFGMELPPEVLGALEEK